MTNKRRPIRAALVASVLAVMIFGVGSEATSAQSSGPQCLRQDSPPSPPDGGAVFARPLDPNTSKPNVVVIPAGSSWDGSACGANADAAVQVMTQPTSIAVSPGAAVLLQDEPAKLYSAWGARDVQGPNPAVLFPGRSDWKTTKASIVDQEYLLAIYNSCRDCQLQGVDFTPTQAMLPTIAYEGDVSGADLTGATLHGVFNGWNLTGATLDDVTFVKASLAGTVLGQSNVDRAVFDGADLRGAHLDALRYTVPPSFAGVRIGPFNGKCTVFTDTDLVNTHLTPLKPDPGCEKTPLLPGSTVRLDLLLLQKQYGASVDFASAVFVADAGDRSKLAGADLHGINLSGASFIGFPANFTNTNFDGASLQRTSFELANLAGATFHNITAPGASFLGAYLGSRGDVNPASFAGSNTNLQGADFDSADVSGVSFQGADLSGAVFHRVLAVGTDFNSVVGKNTGFSEAHIYGDGHAFEAARDLEGADFVGAVLAGDVNAAGGFDFTGADLTDAKFDGAQCISCNFTSAHLNGVHFTSSYLPGAVFAGATVTGAFLTNAWLYCGDLENSKCKQGSPPALSWPLTLGSQEAYGPVPFHSTDLNGVSLVDLAACPDGKSGGTPPSGCTGSNLLPPDPGPTLPPGCSAAALDACPTPTSPLFPIPPATIAAQPLAVAAATPPTWATTLTAGGYYAALDDGSIQLVGDGPSQPVAGHPGQLCPHPTDACGDGGPANTALLRNPSGLAVGLDGSLYVADAGLHRLRRIFPSAPRAACRVASTPRRAHLTSGPRRGQTTARRRRLKSCPRGVRCSGRTGGSCKTSVRRSTAKTSVRRSTAGTTGQPGSIVTVAGNGNECTAPGSDCGDDGPATDAALAGPYGVWVDPTGLLFIADGRRGIREVHPDGTITTVGAAGGTYDIRSVAGDTEGNLYAASNNPDFLLKVNLADGKTTKVVGTGTSGYNGTTDPDTGMHLPGTKVQINHPEGLSIGLDGDVVFADTANNLIRAYVPRFDDVIELGGLISNGKPQGGFNGNGQYADQTKFDHPEAVTVTRGVLFVVADSGNHVVRKFGPIPLSSASRRRPPSGRRPPRAGKG